MLDLSVKLTGTRLMGLSPSRGVDIKSEARARAYFIAEKYMQSRSKRCKQAPALLAAAYYRKWGYLLAAAVIWITMAPCQKGCFKEYTQRKEKNCAFYLFVLHSFFYYSNSAKKKKKKKKKASMKTLWLEVPLHLLNSRSKLFFYDMQQRPTRRGLEMEKWLPSNVN